MANKLYVSDKGYVVQVFGDENRSTIQFSAQGGGFAKQMPRAEFFAQFKPYELPKYTPRRATFEHFDAGSSLNAWSNDARWNGWAMPYFSYEQGLEVIKFFPEVRFDAEQDAFVWLGEGMDEPEVYRSETIETGWGPQTAWPIGAGSWTWEWVDEEEG